MVGHQSDERDCGGPPVLWETVVGHQSDLHEWNVMCMLSIS